MIIYPVPIYKDTTNQYTDRECDWDNCVEIPVPEDLLIQWFKDDKCWNQKVSAEILEDLHKWVYEESTCDETCDLYDWLCNHGYHWKRIYSDDKYQILADAKSVMKQIRFDEACSSSDGEIIVSLTHEDVEILDSAIRCLQEVV